MFSQKYIRRVNEKAKEIVSCIAHLRKFPKFCSEIDESIEQTKGIISRGTRPTQNVEPN